MLVIIESPLFGGAFPLQSSCRQEGKVDSMLRPSIVDKSYHSNGAASSFVAAIIDDPNDGETKLVIMFEEEGCVAVLSLDTLIDEEDISAKSNSHHYADKHEDSLRELLWED